MVFKIGDNRTRLDINVWAAFPGHPSSAEAADLKVGGLLGSVHGQNRAASAPYGMEQTMSWLALWLLVVFSWGLKEIDEAQATTNAQFDSDDTLAAADYPPDRVT